MTTSPNLCGYDTMIMAWLNGREAAEIGESLADEFAPE